MERAVAAVAPAVPFLNVERLSDEVGAQAMALRYQAERNAETYAVLVSNLSFHDLASQTLHKIITFVESLERQLYELLQTYRPVLELEHPLAAPPAAPEGKEATQDEVDRLLGELGF